MHRRVDIVLKWCLALVSLIGVCECKDRRCLSQLLDLPRSLKHAIPPEFARRQRESAVGLEEAAPLIEYDGSAHRLHLTSSSSGLLESCNYR